MTPNDQRFQQYLMRLAQEFKKITLSHDYEITVKFVEELEDEQCKPGEVVLAQIQSNTTYLFATIWVSAALQERWEEGQYRLVASRFLHEFAHILTEPLCEAAVDGQGQDKVKLLRNITERQTQRITYALMNLLDEMPWWMPMKGEVPVKAKKAVAA